MIRSKWFVSGYPSFTLTFLPMLTDLEKHMPLQWRAHTVSQRPGPKGRTRTRSHKPLKSKQCFLWLDLYNGVQRHSLKQESPTRGPWSGTQPCTGPHSRRWVAGKWAEAFICRSPLLALPPKPSTTAPLLHGKIVFHKTGPWCQKGCRLLP